MRALRPGASVHAPRINCNRRSIDPSGPRRSVHAEPRIRNQSLCSERTPSEGLSRCTRIVRTGDAVDPDSVAVGLLRSEILALASAGNLIVGVGAIKRRRRPEYAHQIAERSGVSFDPNTSKLGYVAVDPKDRG